MDMTDIKEIFGKASSTAEFSRLYFEHLTQLMDGLDHTTIGQVIEVLLEARQAGRNIYIMGNGGSAATANHFASDLAIGTRAGEKPFKAISLSANISALSAISNDYGYDEVFFKQVENRLTAGDVIIGISASGKSANVLKALSYAQEMGCITIGFSGFDGGKLAPLAQINVHVSSQNGEYGPVEDLHLVFGHLISNYLMLQCERERNGVSST
jgi:D-sedoheptulose 7-phosphate isomerase